MKTQKSFEGLSLKGIAAQIINSILLWNKWNVQVPGGFVTRNDCNLVINSLIRVYHDRLHAEKKIGLWSTYAARQKRANGEKVVKEHAIPVACVMRELIDRTCSGYAETNYETLAKLIPEVQAILERSAVRAWVTKEEDQKLTLNKLVDRMPEGHGMYPWDDLWIRYRVAGLPEPEAE